MYHYRVLRCAILIYYQNLLPPFEEEWIFVKFYLCVPSVKRDLNIRENSTNGWKTGLELHK